MKKLQFILIVLFLSCSNTDNSYIADYEDARRSTIKAWEEKIGVVSNECYNQSKKYIISEVDVFPDNCPQEDNFIAGCILNKSRIIFILSTLDEYTKVDVAIHEYIHMLSFCELGDEDKNHSDIRLWENLDSVEVWAQAGLSY